MVKNQWISGLFYPLKLMWCTYIKCIDRLNSLMKGVCEWDIQKQIENPFTNLFIWHLLCGSLLMLYMILYMLGFFSLPFTYYESLMHNIIMLTWGVCFLRSAYLDWRYQHRLSFIAPEVLRNQQIPLSTDSLANHPKKPDLYVGTGYDWTVKHRQLLYTLQSERSKVKTNGLT